MTASTKAQIEKLKDEAQWGINMRPGDPDWVADSHNKDTAIMKQLLQTTPVGMRQKLLEKMPRNPATLRYKNSLRVTLKNIKSSSPSPTYTVVKKQLPTANELDRF